MKHKEAFVYRGSGVQDILSSCVCVCDEWSCKCVCTGVALSFTMCFMYGQNISEDNFDLVSFSYSDAILISYQLLNESPVMLIINESI